MRIIVLVGTAFILHACKSSTESSAGATTQTSDMAASAPAPDAPIEAAIQPKNESGISGTVKLVALPDGGVQVAVALSGASPGDHGVHVHEIGDCSAPDGKSAGGHFNPEGHDHALPETPTRHLGDLGNLVVAEDGTGALEFTATGANLKPNDPLSFRGRALIVHAKKDDGGQPTGNAGSRIGCAVLSL